MAHTHDSNSLRLLINTFTEKFDSYSELLRAGKFTRTHDEDLFQSVVAILRVVQETFLQFPCSDEDRAAASLALLAYACFPAVSPQYGLKIAYYCGVIAEKNEMNSELVSEEHGRFMLKLLEKAIVNNYLTTKKSQHNESDLVDLNRFCPPMMTLLSQNIHLLAEFREQHPELLKYIRTQSKMLNELLHICVNEKILYLHYDTELKAVNFGQRVIWHGLSSNSDMRNALFQIDPIFDVHGYKLDMVCWTGLRDNTVDTSPLNPHRVWGEGIPHDIATLDGERVVIVFKGVIGRSFGNNVTFPSIPVQYTQENPLSQDEIHQIVNKICTIDDEAYIEALQHQMGTGGVDKELKNLISSVEQELRRRKIKSARQVT